MNNKVKWYQRREVWGTALTLLSLSPEIINSMVDVGLLKDYTLIAKLVTPIGLILTAFGIRAGNRDKNMFWHKKEKLPGGLGDK